MAKNTHLQKKIGDMVKERRLYLAKTTEEAAKETKIRESYLIAIENSDFDSFPSEVYAKGFLRNYSIYLEMDPESTLRLYRRERSNEKYGKTIQEYSKLQRFKGVNFKVSRSRSMVLVIGISIIMSLIFFGSKVFLNSQKPLLKVDEPFIADSFDSEAYKIDISEETLEMHGEIGIGDTLYLNGDQVDTFGLSEFNIPIEKIEIGENKYTLKSRNQFGIESELEILIIRAQSEETQEPTT